MINFTVGPVQSSDAVQAIGAEQVPYFRTAEFSEIMLENERLIKKFAKTTEDSHVVFMTCSGSGGMETAIMNCLSKDDKTLVVNGGSFGQRFVELLTLHDIPFDEIKLEHGKALKPNHLVPYNGKGYTAFLLQKHETSTGVHYDMNLVADFCKKKQLFPYRRYNQYFPLRSIRHGKGRCWIDDYGITKGSCLCSWYCCNGASTISH